jgi:hypothetical protein
MRIADCGLRIKRRTANAFRRAADGPNSPFRRPACGPRSAFRRPADDPSAFDACQASANAQEYGDQATAAPPNPRSEIPNPKSEIPNPKSAIRNPKCCRGNALLEFLLALPIVVFLTGLAIYMSLALLTKQQVIVEARHRLWQGAQHGHWSDLNLDPNWDPRAGTGTNDMPRGRGEELDRLRPEVEPPTLASSSNPGAVDYWLRVYGNLPGRHQAQASRWFQTQGSLWSFLNRQAASEYWRDSSPWHFHHLDAWKIARSGPLKPIFESFRHNLQGDVAEHFKEVRDDILHRMFHASGDELDDEDDVP